MLKNILIPLVILLLFFSSCMPGHRAARNFLEERSQIAVMLVPPAFTFLYYYPFVPANDPEYFGEPASLKESAFMDELDEIEATDMFMEAMQDELKAYGIAVFGPEEYDAFLSFPGRRYIFSIAQSEIMEYDQQMVDRALIDTTLYRQEFLLRHVARNTWFEFVEVDQSGGDSDLQILYSNFIVADYLDGRFRYRSMTGEVNYEYSAMVISLEDVYYLQQYAGEGNARYIFEFLLNRHVAENTRGRAPQYRYNPGSQSLRRGANGGFIIMESSEED